MNTIQPLRQMLTRFPSSPRGSTERDTAAVTADADQLQNLTEQLSPVSEHSPTLLAKNNRTPFAEPQQNEERNPVLNEQEDARC